MPSRRQLLRLGIMGGCGFALPSLLEADTRNAKSEMSCIFIHQYGGLSQLDSWDMKPGAPAEIRGPYNPISTSIPGFQICELMPKLAKAAGRYSVIRSMTHANSQHDQANAMLLAGKQKREKDSPSFGAMVTKLRPIKKAIPPHVWIQKYGGGAMPPEHTYLTGGNLGAAYAPLLIGKTHNDNPANPDFKVRAFESNEAISENRLLERKQLCQNFRSLSQAGATSEYESESFYHQKSFDLIHSAAARSAFQVEKEKQQVREEYGLNPFGQNLLLARRLIEAGVRLVNVVAWTGLARNEKFVSVETWDMHGNADVGIFEDGWNGLPFALPIADQAVATLLADLEERGMLENTLVVFVGEFGRTPKIRKGAKRIGRDHWPQCYSAMLAGAGIKPGVVYGESDAHAGYVKSNPVTLEDFTATLFASMGISPQSRLSPNGFTQPASERIIDPGTITLESFGMRCSFCAFAIHKPQPEQRTESPTFLGSGTIEMFSS